MQQQTDTEAENAAAWLCSTHGGPALSCLTLHTARSGGLSRQARQQRAVEYGDSSRCKKQQKNNFQKSVDKIALIE